MKSAMMVSAPMHMPPNAAAVGMYRFSSFFSACVVSRWPCAARHETASISHHRSVGAYMAMLRLQEHRGF
jgi:hypothetical protein